MVEEFVFLLLIYLISVHQFHHENDLIISIKYPDFEISKIIWELFLVSKLLEINQYHL